MHVELASRIRKGLLKRASQRRLTERKFQEKYFLPRFYTIYLTKFLKYDIMGILAAGASLRPGHFPSREHNSNQMIRGTTIAINVMTHFARALSAPQDFKLLLFFTIILYQIKIKKSSKGVLQLPYAIPNSSSFLLLCVCLQQAGDGSSVNRIPLRSILNKISVSIATSSSPMWSSLKPRSLVMYL